MVVLLVGASGCARVRVATPTAAPAACVPAGRWIDPTTGYGVAMPDVVARAAASRVVLLGEDHDRAAHHRWQLHVIASIAGRASPITLGFEMFPRRVQSALDRWVAGELDDETFVAESDWAEVWGFDPSLYQPLFQFARMHRIAMRALNVDRSLPARVAKVGWEAIPDEEREGLSTPAPATPSYRALLADAWQAHHPDARTVDPTAFDRFVEAQLVWDRAMAQAIRSVLADRPDTIVVAVMGRGHVEQGAGVPAQLAALGVARPVVLVPWTPERDCRELVPGVADVVFGVDDAAATAENQHRP